MPISSKSSVMAIMVESTEGTPVVPGAATDFVALQDGFSLEPGFNNLENKELKGSIGKAKPMRGLEQPKVSFDHYVRHSGIEGQAPNYKQVLKSVFGTERIVGTQQVTIAGCTTSLVKVGGGLGTTFKRGQALLIKDPVNGNQIRPVHSIATDDLTLGFNLAAAPGTGVGLGKPCMYEPANSGHPPLTVWEYRGNGGAVEMVSGCRVVDASIDIAAGDFISGKYSMEGVSFYFNPVVVTASNNKIDFLDNAATRAATVPAKVYKDNIDFAQAVQDAMNNLGSGNTFTCTYSSLTGKYTITSNGTTLTMKWNTGVNTATSAAVLLGFTTASDSSAALTYTSINALTLTAPYTPSFDAQDPMVAKDNELYIGDATSLTPIKAKSLSFKIQNSRNAVEDVTATSGVSGSVIKERTVSMSFVATLDAYDVD